MKLFFVISISSFLFINGISAKPIVYKNDSIYLKKSKSNEEGKYFAKILYKKDNNIYEIYSTTDVEAELENQGEYRDSIKNFIEFTIWSDPDGSIRSILFDLKTDTAYISDWYNPKAMSDYIIPISVSFKKKIAKVEGKDDKGNEMFYNVSLHVLWGGNVSKYHLKGK